MVADGKLVLALVRGDHHLSETKLADAVGAHEIRAAYPAEIEDRFGASAGSLGPVGVRICGCSPITHCRAGAT